MCPTARRDPAGRKRQDRGSTARHKLELANVKLSVMQENLARGLSVVSRAVSARSTLPVLANVLLKTEDAGLKLTATNLEIGITYWVPGKIEMDGATTVPARLLTDLVGSLQGGDRIDLDLGAGETLHLRCGRFESHLKGIDAEEFPSIQTAGERPTTRIAQGVLKEALRETTFAAATDEARPILTGVLARFDGDQLTLAAADNYRIAVKQLPILDTAPETSVVIPARALGELERVLADTDDPVDVLLAQARNQVLFRLEGIDLISRLIDGQFPNYQQVMPQSWATRAVLDREELLRAVRPAALIAHESANIVKLQVGVGDESGIVVSANAEVGDHVGHVGATVEGDGTTIAFNARYLADVLGNVSAEQVAIELNGPLAPGVFKPIGDDGYVHVVMPVRTTS
jgi:DNA polymerase-3 subunit beta